MPIIRAEGISKCFPIYHQPSDYLWELLGFRRRRHDEPFWAVRDVTVEIERGGCLGIVGENGSGKSTLLRILASVLRPTAGRVRLGGRVSALLELGTGLNPEFKGRENILMSAAILSLTDAQTRRRIPEIERFAEIREFVDRPVKTYSGGMFVRLAFAVAVHLDPDILIVDEALFRRGLLLSAAVHSKDPTDEAAGPNDRFRLARSGSREGSGRSCDLDGAR